MKRTYVDSLQLPKGFPIMEYESVAELQADGGTDERVVMVVNNYLHQKDGLVEGRNKLTAEIEKRAGFAPLTKTVKKTVGGKETEVKSWDETQAEYIRRFVAALVSGEFSNPEFVLTADSDEGKETQVWAVLQTWVEAYDLKNDIKAPERVGKAKTPPTYALEGAKNIISNGRQQFWADRFTSEGIAFDDFQTADEAKNITALAWAIQAREQAKSKKEYA